MSDALALLGSTVLSLAIPAAFVALWLAAGLIVGPFIGRRLARRPDLDPPRRTSRLTDTTPRRLL